MGIIIFTVIVVVVLALAIYGITLLPVIQPPFKQILMVLAVVMAIVAICHRAGFF